MVLSFRRTWKQILFVDKGEKQGSRSKPGDIRFICLPQQHEEQNMFLQKKKHVSVCFFPVLPVHTLLLAPCVKFICLCLLTACNTSAPSGCLLHISRRGLLHSSLTYRSHLRQLMMQNFPSGTPVPLPLYVLPLHAS